MIRMHSWGAHTAHPHSQKPFARLPSQTHLKNTTSSYPWGKAAVTEVTCPQILSDSNILDSGTESYRAGVGGEAVTEQAWR